MKQILELQESEITNKLVIEFYDTLRVKLGAADTEYSHYDCRKICISSFIQDCIYNAYKNRFPEAYQKNPIQFDSEITMLLAQIGPKVSHDLSQYQVLIEEGYLC